MTAALESILVTKYTCIWLRVSCSAPNIRQSRKFWEHLQKRLESRLSVTAIFTENLLTRIIDHHCPRRAQTACIEAREVQTSGKGNEKRNLAHVYKNGFPFHILVKYSWIVTVVSGWVGYIMADSSEEWRAKMQMMWVVQAECIPITSTRSHAPRDDWRQSTSA